MKERLRDKIFLVTNCPDATMLLSYSKEELEEDVAWKVEKHITDCPLCADALEGLLLISGTEVLNEVREQNNYSNNFDFKKHKNRELKIVLTTSVMAITSLVILYFNKPDPDKAASQAKEITTSAVNSISEQQPVQTIQDKEKLIQPPVNIQRQIRTNAFEAITDSMTTLNSPGSASDSSMLWTADIHPVLTDASKEKNNPMLSVSGLPVTYIQELKAIDYTSIYEELDRKKTGLLKSLDPQYQNAKSMEAAKQNQSSAFDTLVYARILSDALLAYREEKYTDAQHAFEKILSVYSDDQNALFYRGLSYYHLEKPLLAVQQLEKIIDHRQSPFNEEAMWYMALSYNKNDNEVLCKQWLEKVIAEKGFYELKAKEFLRGLR